MQRQTTRMWFFSELEQASHNILTMVEFMGFTVSALCLGRRNREVPCLQF